MRKAEEFLARWSRLKRVRDEAEPPQPHTPEGEAPAAPLDVEELPPIDSLGPGSDFSVFMHRSVPSALRVAALRKAWKSNPAIAAHKPLVDYDWDFNAPGYGKLWDVDDAQRLVSRLFKQDTAADQETQPAPDADSAEPPAADHAPDVQPQDEGKDERLAALGRQATDMPDSSNSQSS